MYILAAHSVVQLFSWHGADPIRCHSAFAEVKISQCFMKLRCQKFDGFLWGHPVFTLTAKMRGHSRRLETSTTLKLPAVTAFKDIYLSIYLYLSGIIKDDYDDIYRPVVFSFTTKQYYLFLNDFNLFPFCYGHYTI